MIRYVTRWALSTGIRRIDGEYTDDGKYFTNKQGSAHVFVSAREAHETIEAATACARMMASKKAKALRAQADKLSASTWTPKVVSVENAQ